MLGFIKNALPSLSMASWFETYGTTILMVVLLIGVFYLMYRSQKKQERETNDMRNSLEVGDEITTIGGIIGEIIKIKEETVTIETGKTRTQIRILRSAVRSVDVHAADKFGTRKKNTAEAQDKNKPAVKSDADKPVPTKNKKNKQEEASTQEAKVEAPVEAPVEADSNNESEKTAE